MARDYVKRFTGLVIVATVVRFVALPLAAVGLGFLVYLFY